MFRNVRKRILVVGVGKSGKQNEDLGIEVTSRLQEMIWPGQVDFAYLDFDLPYETSQLAKYEFILFVIAAHTDDPIGFIYGFHKAESKPFYWTKCSFDSKLRTLLSEVSAHSPRPSIDILYISIGSDSRSDNAVLKMERVMDSLVESTAESIFGYLTGKRISDKLATALPELPYE